MNPSIKLIVFDLNKTLIKDNSWEALNLALGVTPEEDKAMVAAHSNGLLVYRDWVQKLFNIYTRRGYNTSKESISKIVHSYTYMDGAREIVGYLQQAGYRVAIISGAMNVLIDYVAAELDIEPSLALANNKFIFNDNGTELIAIETVDHDALAKVDLLMQLCAKLGIDPDQCACVGDGDNDIELFKKTGHGITFTYSPITKEAWKVIENLPGLKEIF